MFIYNVSTSSSDNPNCHFHSICHPERSQSANTNYPQAAGLELWGAMQQPTIMQYRFLGNGKSWTLGQTPTLPKSLWGPWISLQKRKDFINTPSTRCTCCTHGARWMEEKLEHFSLEMTRDMIEFHKIMNSMEKVNQKPLFTWSCNVRKKGISIQMDTLHFKLIYTVRLVYIM